MQITTIDTDLELKFGQPWDTDSYDMFLKSKRLPEYRIDYDFEADTYRLTTSARFASILGIEADVADYGWLPMAAHLWDYQRHFTKIALDAKRFSVWADTGLGKTAMYLEWSRQVSHRTGKRVLIITPLNIIDQVIDEAIRFYADELPIVRLSTREDMKVWCKSGSGAIGIVNHEKFIPRGGEETVHELRYLGGVVLDESSILKSGGGKIKWSLIKSCRGIEYKLSCTATPAPNDTMEYASQASWLEKLRNEGEIIWTYFTRTKDGDWKIKEHAKGAFYRFMAGWSVYLRNPARYGFQDHLKDLPEPEVHTIEIPITPEQQKELIAVPVDNTGQQSFIIPENIGMTHRIRFSQIAKGFIYEKSGYRRIDSGKPPAVASIAENEHAQGHQVIVWTLFDAESEIIAGLLPQATVLTGKTPQDKRHAIIESFRRGGIPILITRASMLGHGLNFQNCRAMIFSGMDDSFERFYQAVRRAYRYGQTETVRVYIPYVPDLEGAVYQNVMEKQGKFMHDTAVQEKNYITAMRGLYGN